MKEKDFCLFCSNIIEGNTITTTDFFKIVVDLYPVSPGHLLIMPKRHMETFFELNETEFADLQKAINLAKELSHSDKLKQLLEQMLINAPDKQSQKAIKKALNDWQKPITGYNLGVNNGASAGQTVFHLHIHLIPRFDRDGGQRMVSAP